MVNRVEKIIGSAEKNRVSREPQVFFLRPRFQFSVNIQTPACVIGHLGGGNSWLIIVNEGTLQGIDSKIALWSQEISHISSGAILYKNFNLCASCPKFLNMLFKVWGNSKEKAVWANSLTDLLKKKNLFKQIFYVDF